MRRLPLFHKSNRTYIMGVLNVTPDSFYDGGRFIGKPQAIRRAIELQRQGADIIDIGGESTRPGSDSVSLDEELSRVIPVVKEVSKRTNALISVDTSKSEVAYEAIRAGADIINDVSGLNRDNNMASVVAKANAGVILMHMAGSPKDMQKRPRYKDVVKDIKADLKVSIHLARAAGIADRQIIVDPGIGFGKTVNHNLVILNRLNEFASLGYPICVGTSRKSFIKKILGDAYRDERLIGTIATCVAAMLKGARIIRVHDAREISSAARMIDSIKRSGDN